MSLTARQANMHLLWRAGFGPSSAQLHRINITHHGQLFQSLLSASQKTPDDYQLVDETLIALANDRQMLRKTMTRDEKRAIATKNISSIKALNLAWMDDMVNSEAQLREKAAFFWHGHFACRSLNAIHQQALLNTIRKNALGNFADLLREVSKSAAMLNFLNNNQNRKGHPNENFAREVMELFTLGRGNYTETDIKEAARAFTGWGANPAGNFIFRKKFHDEGIKTVLGKTGNFDGDDILNLLLEKKETAHFIVEKLYRFYINEQPDGEQVNQLAAFFYNSNYDISALLGRIFTASFFYADVNYGVKIKSPVELLAGIRRMLPMNLEKPDSLIVLQRILGQVLLYPPNVAGWPGGKSWIDSSTLMMRLNLPGLINQSDGILVKPKDDDDQMMGRREELRINKPVKNGLKKPAKLRQFSANVDWQKYTANFSSVSKEKLITKIAEVLLLPNIALPENLITRYADVSTRENYIRSVTTHIMSLPEYQLC